MTLRRAVFLDRDGVVSRTEVRAGKPYAPRRLQDFFVTSGARNAIAALRGAGYVIVIVTNQPDIGNGLVRPAVVEAMHAKLKKRVVVDDIRVCPHRQDEGCACRKPEPGMLIAAARRWNIALGRSYMIGDRAGDVVAGNAAGCYTLLINRRYSELRRAEPGRIVRSLSAGVRFILSRCKS